jgi:hypothetical protein
MTPEILVFVILLFAITKILSYRSGYKKGYQMGELEERIKNNDPSFIKTHRNP